MPRDKASEENVGSNTTIHLHTIRIGGSLLGVSIYGSYKSRDRGLEMTPFRNTIFIIKTRKSGLRRGNLDMLLIRWAFLIPAPIN